MKTTNQKIKKIFRIAKNILVVLQEIALLIVATLIAKDPCKKCLLRPCCTQKCEERIILENLILRGDSLVYRKFISVVIIISVITTIFAIITINN